MTPSLKTSITANFEPMIEMIRLLRDYNLHPTYNKFKSNSRINNLMAEFFFQNVLVVVRKLASSWIAHEFRG
jgi:hypothetical protein